MLKYPYCHQMISQAHPRGNGRVWPVHNLFMQLFTLGSSKIGVSKTYFLIL